MDDNSNILLRAYASLDGLYPHPTVQQFELSFPDKRSTIHAIMLYDNLNTLCDFMMEETNEQGITV